MARIFPGISGVLVVVASLFVVSIFIALGQYAYPSADDFCMLTGSRDHGLFAYLWHHYFSWSGRYTGNALYGLYPYVLGLFGGYPWLAGILILSLLGAMAFLLATLFRLRWHHPFVWLASLLFVCVYLLGLRHTASSLYWLAGAMTYQSAHILLLLTLALILRLIERQRQRGSTLLISSALLVLVVLGAGTNETNMVLLMLIIAPLYLAQRFFVHPHSMAWALLLLVMLVCFAIVYFSPGNAMREASFPLRHDLWRSVDGSIRMGSWMLMVWMSNPVFIAGSLLTPFLVMRLRLDSELDFRISSPVLLILAAFTFAIPFLLQFPAWWAMGGWPPPRTVDAIFFVFLCGWLSLLGALTLRFLPWTSVYSRDGAMRPRVAGMLLLVSVLFVLAVSINSKFQRALDDLVDKAPPFYEYMMKRHELIRQAIADESYSLQAPAYHGEVPHSIYFNDIRPDWRDWRNVCYASYFGLRAIQRERGGDVRQQEQPISGSPL